MASYYAQLGCRSGVAQDVFCNTKPSWQGGRCAPPLHPPGRGSSRVLNPFQSHRPYRRSTTRGRLRSPCTHRLGGRSCPQDPRPFHGDQEGSVRAALPWSHPTDQRACRTPWNPDQPCADWMPIRVFAPRYPRPFHGDQSTPIGSGIMPKMIPVACALPRSGSD